MKCMSLVLVTGEAGPTAGSVQNPVATEYSGWAAIPRIGEMVVLHKQTYDVVCVYHDFGQRKIFVYCTRHA